MVQTHKFGYFWLGRRQSQVLVNCLSMLTRKKGLFYTCIRDGATGELKFELEGHAMGVISVDVSQDGTRNGIITSAFHVRLLTAIQYIGLASSSVDSNIRIWDLEQNGKLTQSIIAAPVESWKIKFSSDGQHIATGSHNGDIHIYSVETGEKVKSLPTKNKFLMCVAYASIT